LIALETNILVYAHRADSPWNQQARQVVEVLANGSAAWAIPWPCVYEFLGIVSRPRIYDPPTPIEEALSQMGELLCSPSLVLLAESGETAFWSTFSSLVQQSRVAGATVHDARIAALCIHHGVTMLYTADRDFTRFPQLKTSNPLVGTPH